MKRLFQTFNIALAGTALLFMGSCEKESDSVANQEQATVEFILSGSRATDAQASSKMGGATSSYTTFAEEDGADDAESSCDMELASTAVLVIEDDTITTSLKTWQDSYKTDPIELDPGFHSVKSFTLLDENGDFLFSTPMENSDMGPFVSQALPYDIEVEEYKKLEYDLEVLCIEDFTPPEFGFAFWDVTIKEIKNLCIFANFCEPESGHEVASLKASIYPDEESTEPEDLIFEASADGDYDSEEDANELLCLKFPYDPSIATEEQSFYVELLVNDVLFEGTMPLNRIDEINEEDGYLHLNENCQGDFDVFSTTYNIGWEDLNDDGSANDVDYNDFLCEIESFTDTSTGELNFVFTPLARGGGYDHAFEFFLPGHGYMITGASSVIEGGNTKVTVYPNTRQAAFGDSSSFINTKCGGTTGSGIVKTVQVDVSGASDFAYYLLNPFDANLDINNDSYDLTVGNLFPASTFKADDGQVLKNGLITPKDYQWVVDGKDVRDTYGPNFHTNFVVQDPTDLYDSCN